VANRPGLRRDERRRPGPLRNRSRFTIRDGQRLRRDASIADRPSELFRLSTASDPISESGPMLSLFVVASSFAESRYPLFGAMP